MRAAGLMAAAFGGLILYWILTGHVSTPAAAPSAPSYVDPQLTHAPAPPPADATPVPSSGLVPPLTISGAVGANVLGL